jgi:hypothetical protein
VIFGMIAFVMWRLNNAIGIPYAIQRLAMVRAQRHIIIIIVLALVMLAPAFELFDESEDLDQGTDFVFVLLLGFVSIGLIILCKSVLTLLLGLQRVLLGCLKLGFPLPRRTTRFEIAPHIPLLPLSPSPLRI